MSPWGGWDEKNHMRPFSKLHNVSNIRFVTVRFKDNLLCGEIVNLFFV